MNDLEQCIKNGFGFKPKAVLFDMDGVIYDSMKYQAYAWHKTMTENGIPMSEEDCYAHEGMKGVETIRELAKERCGLVMTDEEVKALYKKKCDCFATCPKPEKMPGTEELMKKIQSFGAKIIVVTGSGQHIVLDRLENDFKGLIVKERVVTCYDVKRGKPHADPYLKGLEIAGVSADEAVVVENAPLGVKSGKAAEIFTVAVNTGPLPDSMLKDAGADIVFPSMWAFTNAWERMVTPPTSD